MIFFSYLTDFSYFPLTKYSESCRRRPEQLTKWAFWKGVYIL